ncbi:MAG: ATPase domain-containing protein [archaeon]
MLKKWGCTSIIISELPPRIAEIKEGSVGFLTDAIISLYYSKEEQKGVRVHSCEIMKMRGTKHSNKLLAINFEKNGIVIYPEVEVF